MDHISPTTRREKEVTYQALIIPFVDRETSDGSSENMAAAGAEMKRPAEGDGLASPRKKARKNSLESEGEASDGEVSDGLDEGEVDSDGDSKVPNEDNPSGAGPALTWNSGVTNKLRTSFGASSQLAEHPQSSEPGLDVQSRLTTEVPDGLAAAFRADETRIGSPIDDQDLSWKLPAFKADSVVGNNWSEVLDSMLVQWCPEFLAANQANIDQVGLGGSFLKKAFNNRLKRVPGLSPDLISKIKRQMKQRFKETRLAEFAPGTKLVPGKQMGKGARREAKERARENPELDSLKNQKTLRSENPTRIQPSRHTGGQKTSPQPSTSDDSSSPSADLDTGESVEGSEDEVQSTEKGGGKALLADPESVADMADIKDGPRQLAPENELEQRHRYYPGLPDDAVFCLTCASYEHTTADCPETTCRFCQQDHFSYHCPSRQRCGKCKQLGHAKSSCKEKLATAPGEGFLECAFCEAQDHQEEDCTEIWQTYRPQVGHTKKVKSLPIFCYCCGAEGHFGSDCGLSNPRLPYSETWSLANASMYLDFSSTEVAIAYKIVLPQATATSVSAPVIPGRSIKPQSHIIFEDSGDEEADTQGFVRAPATGPKRSGQIQITSNINFGGAPAGTGSAQQESSDLRHRTQRVQQYKLSQKQQQQQQSSLPPKPVFAQQQQQQKGNGLPSNPPPPAASKKGKKKGGRSGNKAQQQPPLPSGPPPGPPMMQGNSGWRPQELMPRSQQGQGRGASRGRGRGGFSSLGRGGGRGGRGRRNN